MPLLAATALEHSMTVGTRIVDDFVSTGVPLVNLWEKILPSDQQGRG